jgi:hypothetical protein
MRNKWTKIAVLSLCAVAPILMAPRDGSGNYTLPAGNPVVSGTTISSTVHNNTNSDIATAITSSLAKDGQTTPTANLPMGTFRHTNVGNPTLRNQYGTVDNIQDGDYVTLSSVAGTNTVTGAMSPAITAYVAGMHVVLIPANTNTGATTLNVSSVGALDVQKYVSGAQANIVANDLRAGVPAFLVLDTGGDDWILLNPNSGSLGDVTIGTLTATTINASGTITGGNLTTAGTVTSATISNSGTVTSGSVAATATLTVAGQSARDATNLFNTGTVPAARLPGSFNGFANPTATIGLTAINGSAATAMRSDGSPALSQSIAPTWSAQHIFNLSSAGGSASGLLMKDSVFGLQESTAAADSKNWDALPFSTNLIFRMLSDNNGTANSWMQVSRSGATPSRVAFPFEASGGVTVGTVSGAIVNSARFYSRGTAASAAHFATTTQPTAVLFINNEASAGDNLFISFSTDGAGLGTTRGTIDFNRGGTATRYNTTSDERLKKSIKPAGSARALINAIPIEQYDWRESGIHVPHGFVAQHLNKVAPDCVSSSKDPKVTWAVEKACLVPALIKYVQEQDARIDALESQEVGLLIKEVQELRNRVQQLESEPRFVTFDPKPAAANRGTIHYNHAGGAMRYNLATDRQPRNGTR